MDQIGYWKNKCKSMHDLYLERCTDLFRERQLRDRQNVLSFFVGFGVGAGFAAMTIWLAIIYG